MEAYLRIEVKIPYLAAPHRYLRAFEVFEGFLALRNDKLVLEIRSYELQTDLGIERWWHKLPVPDFFEKSHSASTQLMSFDCSAEQLERIRYEILQQIPLVYESI